MRTYRVLPILLLALAACGAGGEKSEEMVHMMDSSASAGSSAPTSLSTAPAAAAADEATATTASNVAAAASGAAAQVSLAPAMIIRTGTAQVEVDSVQAAVARVQRMARSLGGYVGNTTLTGGTDEARTATLELKIPSARFDEAVSGLRPLGKVEAVQVQAQDVSEEFVDLSSRAVNAKRLEARLLELLATRPGKLEDLLALERELSRVRQEIEVMEGRMRFLSQRASVSTLTVTLHERAPLIGGQSGPSPIGDAFRESWDNFVGVIAGLISLLGGLIPIALVLAGFWAAYRRLRRRAPHSRPAQPPVPVEPPVGARE